jgi:hypothetical protein
VPGRPRVGGDALADVLRLADVEHLAGRVEHAVDAGRRRRELGVPQQHGAAARQRRRSVADLELRLVAVGQRLLFVVLDEFACRIDVFVATGHAGSLSFCRHGSGSASPHGK